MTAVPLLIISDSPDARSGLARIASNIAQIAVGMPEFRVAFLGRGGTGTCKLPFMQYNFPESAQWGEDYIERAWMDFAGQNRGIILTVWDSSRLHWFSRPQGLPESSLRRFLTSERFHRWGYFPVDGHGPDGRLHGIGADAILGYDRVLAYGIYGAGVLGSTLGREVNWIPHGINMERFAPRGREAGKAAMRAEPDECCVGIVMTNQARKDWGTAFEMMAMLANADRGRRYRFWVHVDVLERHWNIAGLVEMFGLQNHCTVTVGSWMRDYDMSFWYSACDVTVLPSLGEGFGYPIVESLACGVPCITGKYAGGVELVPRADWLLEPECLRLDGLHGLYRPVWDAEKWAARVKLIVEQGETMSEEGLAAECRRTVSHLDWNNLRPVWEKWLREGLGS